MRYEYLYICIYTDGLESLSLAGSRHFDTSVPTAMFTTIGMRLVQPVLSICSHYYTALCSDRLPVRSFVRNIYLVRTFVYLLYCILVVLAVAAGFPEMCALSHVSVYHMLTVT